MKFSKVILGGALIVVLGSAFFLIWSNKANDKVPIAQVNEQEIDNLVIDDTWLPKSIYPQNNTEVFEINFSSYIFEPLVAYDSENHIIPKLAYKWDNPDDLTLRLYLDSNARFSDGSTVTSQDVKYSYDYLTSSDLPMKDLLPKISRINILSDKTLELVTDKPDPVLLNKLAMDFLIMSKADMESGASMHIGSGPYKLASINDTEVSLARNENYWLNKPKVKNVTFKLVANEAQRLEDLINKKADIATYITSTESIDKIDSLPNKPIKKLTMTHGGGIVYLSLDETRNKSPYIDQQVNPLKDLRVRTAMYQALNIDEMILALNNSAIEADQLTSIGVFGFNPEIKRPPYDVEAAKNLMIEAGYPNGFNITFDYGGANPKAKTVMEIVAKQLKAVNITVTLNSMNNLDDFYKKIDSRDTSAYRSGYASDSKDSYEILAQIIHTPEGEYGAYNLGYSNSDVDQLIEQTKEMTNQRQRLTNLQRAMKIAMDEIAVIPLIEEYDLYAYDKKLDWKPRLDGFLRIDEIRLK